MSTPFFPIREVCSIEKGGLNPQANAGERFAHYSIPAFDDGSKPVFEDGSEIKSQKTIISRGTVLVSKLNPRIPRVWFVDDEHDYRRICSTEFVPFVPDSSKLLPEYLALALRRLLSGGQITGSTSAATKSRERAKPSDIAALLIPVPALCEQRRIVDQLSRAEGIVHLRRQAQQKAAALIPAVFADMFGRLPQDGFQRAEEICHFITKGTTPKSQDLASKSNGDAVPFIKVLHIADDGSLEFERQPSFISRTLHEAQFGRSVVYPNDVLMNIVGPPLGRITKVPSTFGEWNINQALAIFRPRESVLPTFLFHALRSSMVLPEILKLPVGVRQLNISLAQCRNIRIPVPPLAQQQTFVDAALAMESILSLQRAATLRADAAFQALLAKSFGKGEAHPEVHNLERALA